MTKREIEPVRGSLFGVNSIRIGRIRYRDDDDRLLDVATSLDLFGQLEKVVLAANGRDVVDGRVRVAAARRLGWTHIVVGFVQFGPAEPCGIDWRDHPRFAQRRAEIAANLASMKKTRSEISAVRKRMAR